MRIEKIELNGFKSFADRTVFNLHPGVTCVVGPNGSGKSNVVDSFRWVLGEQSAKSLRSDKMEEVIFNGSATKKPKGMSEVNLVVSFDTPENGASATSLSRRLYRSGESEYYINKTHCRLKDIRDILLDTGLEVRSYSILAQGQINEIINAKPLERRFLIEEVAGVMKYKVRRAEALSKLESSRANLQRVNDIIAEVRRQINSLDRQVKKAERYKKLSTEMGDIELRLAKRDYLLLQEAMERILAECAAAREQEALKRADINRIENEAETKRIGLLDKEKHLETLNSGLQGLERDVAEKERAIAVSLTESANHTEYLAKLSQQEIDIDRKISDTNNRKKELASASLDLQSRIETLEQELSREKESLLHLEAMLSEKDALIESRRKELFTLSEDSNRLKNEAGRLHASIESLDRKNASAARNAEAVKAQLAGIEEAIKNTEKSLTDKNGEILVLSEKKKGLASEIDADTARLNELRDNLSRTREELASASSRLESLREIMHEESSEIILQERERLKILGAVAEIIEVDEQYEKAIENALNEKVNGLIMPSLEDILTAISALNLQQGKVSKAVFLPMDVVSDEITKDLELSASAYADSVIGRACDLLRAQPDNSSFSHVVKALLRNVFVVKDLPAAINLFKANKGTTFVTLDGEIMEPSGAVTAGGGDRGILKRKREIRELAGITAQKKTAIETIENTITDLDSSVRNKYALLRETETYVISMEKETSLLRLTAENQTEEKARLNRNLENLLVEIEETARENALLINMIAEKDAAGESVNARKAEAEQIISDIRTAIAKDRETYEAGNALITELRLSINSFRERLESARKEMESSEKTLADLSGSKAHLSEEKSNIDSRLAQCAQEIADAKDNLKRLVIAADDMRQKIAGSREIFRNESEGLVSMEQESRSLRNSLDALTAKITEAEVSTAEHRLRTENLCEGIRQNYGIDIDSFTAGPVATEDEERLLELKAKIQELGPVNLGSLDEYEELKNRFDFLSKQQDDLNKSMAELEEAITKINSTTRKKLREAFDLLSVKFSEVFLTLFGGGKAALVLTDENNILETGIDIIAQPPGKKLQNINLLSGGEKALTALSALFASFLIKPSPLCVMDEVDAALDDANIERFAKMLRQLAANIQFIVITHNRITMEAADYIYGITTQEPGVSKVISMQLSDKLETVAV